MASEVSRLQHNWQQAAKVVNKWDRKGWLGCELRKESTWGKGVNGRTNEEMRKMLTAQKHRPLDVEKSRPGHVYEGVAPFARRHPLT